MNKIGELFGFITIFLFSLAALRYLLKFIFKTYGKQLKSKYPSVHVRFMKFMDFMRTNHKWFGIATLLSIAIHIAIQFSKYGLSTSGLIAAVLMLLQVVSGITGEYFLKKPRPKAWLYGHRASTVALIAAILYHVL